MARRAGIRASDEDREQVAERLRHAAAEGRLLASELEHRMAAALRARTYAELDPLTADLPRRELRRRPTAGQVVTRAAVAAVAVMAVMAVVGMVLLFITGLAFVWFFLVMIWMFTRGRFAGRRTHHLRYAPRRSLL